MSCADNWSKVPISSDIITRRILVEWICWCIRTLDSQIDSEQEEIRLIHNSSLLQFVKVCTTVSAMIVCSSPSISIFLFHSNINVIAALSIPDSYHPWMEHLNGTSVNTQRLCDKCTSKSYLNKEMRTHLVCICENAAYKLQVSDRCILYPVLASCPHSNSDLCTFFTPNTPQGDCFLYRHIHHKYNIGYIVVIWLVQKQSWCSEIQ